MKKIYMAPDMVIENIKFNAILLGLSGGSADDEYPGGGDAKLLNEDISAEDLLF